MCINRDTRERVRERERERREDGKTAGRRDGDGTEETWTERGTGRREVVEEG